LSYFPIFLYFVGFCQNTCGFKSDRSRRWAAAVRGTVIIFFLQIFNLTPNGCENRTFLKRHTHTHTPIFSAKIALFFHIFKNITRKKIGRDDKNSWNSAKKGLFLHTNFYFRKIKIKVAFGYEKSSFSRYNYENCGPKFFGGG